MIHSSKIDCKFRNPAGSSSVIRHPSLRMTTYNSSFLMAKRSANSEQSPLHSEPPSSVYVGCLDCYDFLSPNEYSDRIFGLFACLLRKSVSDINLSDIFREFLIRAGSEPSIDLLTLLRNKRDHLHATDASIEKCLMLNRWIKYLEKNGENVMRLISEIHTDMINQITDNQQYQMINYPDDFRQREHDFHRRLNSQNMRRLFYYTVNESKAPNIIQLKNQTTEHLNYLVDSKMRYDAQFRQIGLKEMETIFGTSFMIINQPHNGVHPVLVYEKKPHGIYTVKVSVTIVSLLHDFMKTHVNMIELDHIKLTLCPTDSPYELDDSPQLSWKNCELQINSNERSQMMQCAELTEINIRQKCSSRSKQTHFADGLFSLTFLVVFRLNLNEYKISTSYQIPLQSLPFAIGAHTSHIPHLLTKVILNDIERFSQIQPINVEIVLEYVLRYFMHRTGVRPKADLQIYLSDKLTSTRDKNLNCQSLEDIFMDFLFPFVRQVEFMAKHPVLAMFYTDGVFLGPCDGDQIAVVIKQPTDGNSSIAALRFNAIKTDLETGANDKVPSKSMKAPPCFVRVDIYNARTDVFQNRTFSGKGLFLETLKFISTANESTANYVRILSNSSDLNEMKTYQFFTEYYHERLDTIHKEDPKYKLIVNLLVHVEENTGRQHINGPTMSLNNAETNGNMPIHGIRTAAMNTVMQNGVPIDAEQPRQLSNDQEVIEHVLSHPRLLVEIVRRFRQMQTNNTRPPVQQQQQQQQPAPLPMHLQYYSHQPPPPFVIANQSNSMHSYQYVPGNGVPPPSHQYPNQPQYIPISGNGLPSYDFRLDQTPTNSTTKDNEQSADDFFSSSEGSQ